MYIFARVLKKKLQKIYRENLIRCLHKYSTIEFSNKSKLQFMNLSIWRNFSHDELYCFDMKNPFCHIVRTVPTDTFS